ncbi:FxsA family protein [Chrysiogenes arsenatis]|uniref:FxsA family protein n=1 Tax=Chrysiogenes arsenatis TaxID=309797 RepID=UPI000406179E|nr:FxsA family protein [Chrysiogenes arsenatis]
MPLFLLFVLVPLIELAVLIHVGSHIGIFNTIAIVIITAMVGSYYARREGIAVVLRIQTSLAQGVMPAGELVEGLMIFAGGAMLLTPGFVTDAMGLALIFPVSRSFFRSFIEAYWHTAIRKRSAHHPHTSGRDEARKTIIDVEFHEHDPKNKG